MGGRRQQRLHRLVDHVAGDARQAAAELPGQLRRRRPVVGEHVGPSGLVRLVDHRLGHADVATGPVGLGDGVVRDLADAGRAEPPPPALDLQQAGVGEGVEDRAADVLAERLAELDQRAVRARRPEHRGVVEHRPLVDGQLVEPGRDEGPQGVGQLEGLAAAADQLGQLLQEQRVAAAALVELVGERIGWPRRPAWPGAARRPRRGRGARGAASASSAGRAAAASAARRPGGSWR